MSYYVYLEDTGSGDSYVIETSPDWNGPGSLADGPFQTEADAEQYIEGQGVALQLDANPNPYNPVPGAAKTSSGYPQYGVKETTTGYSTVEATSAAQKTAYLKQGYDMWFTSQSAAKDYVSSESSGLAGNVPSGLSSLGNDLSNAYSDITSWETGIETVTQDLTSAAFWIRAAKVVIGGTLLIVGLAHVTGADNAVARAARNVPLPV